MSSKLQTKIASLIIGTSLGVGLAHAAEEKVIVEHTKRDWIHYNTNVNSLGISSITSIGYIGIKYGKETGKSKIFPELNLFGIGQISKNPNLDFSANSYEINYGLKTKLNQFELTAGVGVKDYFGTTNCKDSGCKDIEANGHGITIKLENTNSKETFDLSYKLKNFEPTQYHKIAFVPVPLKQETKTIDEFLDLKATLNHVIIEVDSHFGKKEDKYSLLIPQNNIKFNETTLGIYPRFNLGNNQIYLGPTFCVGSVEGSIAKIDINSCYGIKIGTENENLKLYATYTKKKGDGNNSFTEFIVDENLTEEKFTFGLETKKINANTYYSRKKQSGNINISSPQFQFIAGGTNFSNNEKNEEYGINIGYNYDKKTKIYLDLNGTKSNGKLYNNPKYSQSGLTTTIGLEKQF